MKKYWIFLIIVLAVSMCSISFSQLRVGKFSIGTGAMKMLPNGGEMNNRFSPSDYSFSISPGYFFSDRFQMIFLVEYAKLTEAEDLWEDEKSEWLDKNQLTVMPMLLQMRYYPIWSTKWFSPFISAGAGFYSWKNERSGKVDFESPRDTREYIVFTREHISLGYSIGIGVASTYPIHSFVKGVTVEFGGNVMVIFDDLFPAEMYGFRGIFPIPLNNFNLAFRVHF